MVGGSGSKAASLNSKLATAHKTGVLNLSDMEIKASSSVWVKIQEEVLIPKIKTIDVSGNQVKGLPVEIYSMVNLKTLHASRCGIQRISDLSTLDKLTVLNLDRNDLEIDMMQRLPASLVRVNLSFNHFSAVPPALTALVAVTELNLENNRIESLDGIGALVALVFLNLNDNHVCELPEEMCALVRLRSISLNNNRIQARAASRTGQSIPASFLLQTQVDTMELSGNPGLLKQQVLEFEGINAFIERRRKIKVRRRVVNSFAYVLVAPTHTHQPTRPFLCFALLVGSLVRRRRPQRSLLLWRPRLMWPSLAKTKRATSDSSLLFHSYLISGFRTVVPIHLH